MGVAAGIGLALAGLSTIGGAIASYNQAEAQNRAARANAEILQANATNAHQEAEYHKKQGDIAYSQARDSYRKLIGTQTSGYGAAGVTLAGSPMDVNLDTVAFGEVDARNARATYYNQAASTNAQANSYLAQSRAASAAQTSPWLAAGTSLLSGASGLAGSLYSYYQTRPTTNSALCAAAGC